MSQGEFIRIVSAVIEPQGVRIFGSKQSKLNALARAFGAGHTDVAKALQELQLIFAADFNLGRHEYAEIEKQLKRHQIFPGYAISRNPCPFS